MPDHPTAADVADLLAHRAAAGVLSIYVDADPSEQSAERPAFEVRLKNELKAIASRDDVDPSLITELLDDERMNHLVNPAISGRTRVMFASREMNREFAFDLPLRTRAVLSERPFVRPLVTALDRGAAYGIVALAGDHARVLESCLGSVTEIWREGFADPETPRERRGPASANPARGQQAATHLEQVEAHDAEWRRRFISSVVAQAAETADARGWTDIVLTAGAEHRSFAEKNLASACSATVAALDANLAGREDDDIVREARPAIDRRRAERRVGAAESALSGAASPDGLGAGGMQEVSRALVAGRVAVLLFDDSARPAGVVADDGTVSITGGTGAREPHVMEHLVERAYANGAQVVPLAGDEAHALSDCEGVAAQLRW